MIPVLPVALPLLTAAFLAAFSKMISERLSQLIAIVITLTVLAANVYLLKLSSVQPVVYWFGGWRPRHGLALGISFVIDPMGAGLGALTALLTFAAFVFSSEYFDSVGTHFHALMLAFLGSMCGFALTGDLFNLFVFFELMSAAGFALCGYKTDDPGSVQGALNFAVTNTIAAYFVLTGIGLIYARTAALNMAQIGRQLTIGPLDKLVLVGFVFLVCGYLVKAAIVPFHFWLADAHAVAPTPVCVLFSGVMVGMGLFALARIYWAAFDPSLHSHLPALTNVFVYAGVMTAFVGALMCYLQRNLKRLLAFSTISHMGLVLIGVGLFSPRALAGAAVYALGHGLVKGSLFLVAGILLHRFGTVDQKDLHGKAWGHWPTATVLLLGSLGLAGLPFSGLALGHDLVASAAQQIKAPWLSWIFVFAGAMTAAAVLRAGAHIFFGWGSARATEGAPKHEEKSETQAGHHHTPLTMFLPAAGLAVAGLLIGFLPHLQEDALRAAQQFENSRANAEHVLESVPVLELPTQALISSDWPTALLTCFAALALSGLTLSLPRGQQISSRLKKLTRPLHQLHSGHIGDYVTFLIFGMGCFALVCSYCLT